MFCNRCKRPLRKATATITTRDGVVYIGPRCAVLMQLIDPPRKSDRPRARRVRATNQLPLRLEE